MEFVIENSTIKVTVKSKGAELSSYFNKELGLEYVWQADPQFWGKHAPLLFPVIGKVYNDHITFEDTKYPMVKHGFARDLDFELQEHGSNFLTLALCATAQTKISFPLDFEFLVKYTLEGNVLKTAFEVQNKGETQMYFSIGGHPAFNCPIKEDDELKNCFISFSEEEHDDKVLIDANGFRNGTVTKDYLKGNKINLFNDIFKDDALVFLNLKSKALSIQSTSNSFRLNFSHEGFPHFGIWAPVGAPFVCLEPWHGMADSAGFTGEFKHKDGVVALGHKQIYRCSYSIEGC